MKIPVPIFEGLITEKHTVFYADYVKETMERWSQAMSPKFRAGFTFVKESGGTFNLTVLDSRFCA